MFLFVIGVVAEDSELHTAAEFFELFKTPWEPAEPQRQYPVVVSTGDATTGGAAVVVRYGSREQAFDRAAGAALTMGAGPLLLSWKQDSFPVYGALGTFNRLRHATVLTCADKAAGYRNVCSGRTQFRIGYDLFREVEILLQTGQPASHARVPTLELHVDLLRQCLIESGVPFVEVPPRPRDYVFICCLTHDVDFFGVTRHKLDRTLGGFLARGSVGTLTALIKGRRTLAEALRNWTAILTLPFVYAGLKADPWQPLRDYASADGNRRSTFFLVPFRNRPGVAPNGAVERARAVAYQASDVRTEAMEAARSGNELSVHGIDAWSDPSRGRAELAELCAITGRSTAGVRMHWLYFDPVESPRRLEAAGFEYDSTCGYNDAVGFRAGTAQAFRPANVETLLELPLSIMDTALFYRDRMGLLLEQALAACRQVIGSVRRFGGALVVNWHDRSLAPERLWNRGYAALLREVEAVQPVWFATAGEAAAWFRWRRGIAFNVDVATGAIMIRAPRAAEGLPGARLRVHSGGDKPSFRELAFDGGEAALKL